MSQPDYTNTVQIHVPPSAVFKAITSEVDKWWSIQSNVADQLNSKLTVGFGTTIKEFLITEFEENKKITWDVTHAFMDIEKLSNKSEWVGTKIIWEISPSSEGSTLNFRHQGLVPEFECWEACENGWNYFLESLKNYLEKGQGTPHGVE